MVRRHRRHTSNLSNAEKVCLALRAQQGDVRARDRLVESCLGLVRTVARHYRGRGLPMEDLVEEGVVGLLEAIPTYDPARHLRFMHFAGFRVRNAVGRAVEYNSKHVRLPAYLAYRADRVRRAREALRQRLERDPTYEEVTRALNPNLDSVVANLTASLHRAPTWEEMRAERQRRCWDPVIVARILAYEEAFPESRPVVSLEGRRIDVPDAQAEEAGAGLEADDAHESIEAALRGLRPQEEKVLRLRWGLPGGAVPALPALPQRKTPSQARLTLNEIAGILGLTRERVRQIEAEALREMERRLAIRQR